MDDEPNGAGGYQGPQLLEALLNSAVGAIITIDETGIVQSVNPATERLFGFTADEIIGQNVSQLMPMPHRSRHDGYLRHHLLTGERRIIGIGREVEGQRKDGTRFPMHLSVSAFSIEGRRYFAGIVHDLTARNEAQAESSRQESLFKAIFDNVPDAMLICDARLAITLCNAAAVRIFDVSSEALIGRPVATLLASEADRACLDMGSPNSCGAGAEPVILSMRRGTGHTFMAATQCTHIIDRDGITHGNLLVMRDLTREMAREQALRRSQRMEALGQLTGGIAHDFNNLLTIITGNHELLETELEVAEQRDLLRRANSAALMGARLTSRLLTFARRRPLEAVLLDLNEQVISMLDLLRRTIGEQIEFSSLLTADLWKVRSDPSEIENAVLNLAINARDAMPGGGRLIVETRNAMLDESAIAGEIGVRPGEYVCLSVSDTGTGMTAEIMARVFEPFFTTKETGKGTGLGLSVVYGFARQSGGHVTIYSEVGRGTTVNLYLPRAAEAHHESRTASSTDLTNSSSGETILVVEDQAQVREVTLQRLQRLGYSVIEADSAHRAIELLQRGLDVDLVFSDVVMPGGMSGLDLASWIEERMPHVAVLLTSGFAEDVVRDSRNQKHQREILRKPYARDELARALRRSLQR